MQVGSVDRPSGCSSATGANVVSHTQFAAAVEVALMARNQLQPQHVPALVEQLGKFPSLKRLDVSANPGLRLLPVGLLQIAATLEAFHCNDCPLALPPQSFFSSVPEENPKRIQQLLQSGSSAVELKLSALNVTAGFCAQVASEVAALLRHYPALQRLDVSTNPHLDRGCVLVIVKALSSEADYQHVLLAF